jgi:hypothetical protein
MRWLKTSFLLAADFERAQNDAEPQYLVSPTALATNLPTEPADPSNKYATMSLAGAERVLAARAPAEFDPESLSSRFSYRRKRYGRNTASLIPVG